MSRSDEPENEERWGEWDRMLDDVSSSIRSLAEAFTTNSSHEVLACADRLTAQVVAIHGAAGVLHLATDPVIDVAGDADLVARWNEAEPFFDDDETDDRRAARESGVAFQAIAAAAHNFCELADRALCQVAGEVEETGWLSPRSLTELADDAAKLVEWTRIYGSSVLGLYRVTGSMPDGAFGGGPTEEMLEYERAEQLASNLVGANPWQ